MGGTEHEGEWERLNAQWSYDPGQNSFPLPHEVFELGLEQGALLVYVYLVYHKSLKHSPNALSCAIVSKAVGLCEKNGAAASAHAGKSRAYSDSRLRQQLFLLTVSHLG